MTAVPGDHELPICGSTPQPPTWWLPRERLQQLFDAVLADGFELLGPTLGSGAIIYGPIREVADLPIGWTEVQEAGRYRLERRSDNRCFGFTVGPHSWKRYLFPPTETLVTGSREAGVWTFTEPNPQGQRQAYLGVRGCELAAIAIQDRVFLQPGQCDPGYAARRNTVLLIAVECTQAAPTCFCTSLGTGPDCGPGFDLALTEIEAGFVVRIGTAAGRELVDRLGLEEATDRAVTAAREGRAAARDQMRRHLPTAGLRDGLLAQLKNPRWDEIAQRCLSCANCTAVCPTCFCSSVVDVPSLDPDMVTRERRWDSCFQHDFSWQGGGVIRQTIAHRYRQWLTHKLATWHDQFGVSGCVGCGRCITWCPVEIDLTVEVPALLAAGQGPSPGIEAAGGSPVGPGRVAPGREGPAS